MTDEAIVELSPYALMSALDGELVKTILLNFVGLGCEGHCVCWNEVPTSVHCRTPASCLPHEFHSIGPVWTTICHF